MYHVFLLSLTLATATAEYDFMSGVIWGGPDKGCDSSEGAGQAVISCTLNSGNVTLNVDRSASWLKVTCEENSSFSCSELAEARPHISKYATMNGEKGRQISRLDVDSCRLPEESLVCLLDLVNASSAVLLRLIHCEGKVTARNLDGMDAVKFRMNYIDKNTTMVPYPALSQLKSLRSFTLKGGSLVLDVQNVSLPNLRTLELADGRLEVINNDVFMNTPNIQTLMLWGNKISKIHENAFKGLHDLVNVSLNSNEISSLPNKIFSHSPLIRRVDLYDNRLVILQKDLFSGLQHLEEVIITSNKANLSLEETFSNLPSLKNLKLETSNIEKLPENLFKNSTSLKTLLLGGNRLENLPPTIFSDQKLVVLNLYDNRISELPAVLFKNQTLMERLDLRKNLINNIPGGLFSDAKNLKVCDLSDNQIELLERLILSLARNNLTISKSMNTIALLPTDEYYNEDYAKTFLHYSMFKSLKYIKILNLSKNNVSLICEDWRQLIGLKKLDLSYNNIDFLSDISMSFDFSDAVVDVRNNKITTILPPVYNNDTQKPTFILNDNPFTCDCYLYDFIQRYKSTKSTPILQMDSATCASPRSLKNTHISELTPEQLFCDVPCNNCTCKIKPYNSRFVIDCEEMPSNLPQVSKEFEAMNLTNEIHLKRSTQVIPSYYKYVDLSNLNLTTAPSVVSSVELNLTNNHLKSAPLDLLLNNCTLYLSNNPFLCSCNDYENVEYLMKYKHLIRDYKEIRCEDGGLVSNVNIETICVARNSVIIGSTVSVIGVILVIIIAIYYKYSTEIRILLRKYHLWWGDEFDHEKEYDAFVSYSHQDENYVVEHLVPNLEGGKPPLKLCVHYRNWVIGDFIPTQIARSVEQSRITIIVLSKHFINSIWGHMEFRTAHGKGKVIILMLDDISTDEILDPELKAYIAMNTYVKSKDPLVFDRIRDAVLSKGMNKTSGGLNVQLKDGKLVNVNKDIEVAIQ
ncbi:unnamed protein product [Danaus chrysippus]|uniref:(African queen) hypothetical protein n=1 Tax=Danaus chrysippus TaxID=151541 RepID=A0A8J2RDD5_9NEOP|nr:unnamed protein product [Danaus chrysippus]